MKERVPARWYFDVISPYAYLYLKRFDELRPVLDIEFVPILFAGLLKHWDNKGPAEIAPKRLHTYRNCVWLAEQHAIPFRLPPLHPFNPLQVQRLLVALGSTQQAIGKAFDFIWCEGRDPGQEWPALCDSLGLNPAEAVNLIADPAVKQRLATNTATAAASGVFGVPTLSLRNENFWGCEMIGLVNAFVDDADKFQTGEMKRVGEIGIGASRKESA